MVGRRWKPVVDPEENPETPEVGEGCGQQGLPLWGALQNDTVVWSIAGFDPSSGAGVTADLMTFAAHGLFGCSAITALTVQSTRGVYGWEPVAPEFLRATVERLGEDLPPAGLKIGMLGGAEAAWVVGKFLAGRRVSRAGGRPVVVLDPVLRSSSGRALVGEGGLAALHEALLPQVDWITPNWGELALLAQRPVKDLVGAEAAARSLGQRHRQMHVAVTGGDGEQPVDLLLTPEGECSVFAGERVETTSTHGTGCAFSSALVCELVRGAGPAEAVRRAKAYVEGALRWAPRVGRGRGPMGLLWPLRQRSVSGGASC